VRKEDMLHTVTNEFLQDKYPTSVPLKTNPVKPHRIEVDPAGFRANLRKKIEEIRMIEMSN